MYADEPYEYEDEFDVPVNEGIGYRGVFTVNPKFDLKEAGSDGISYSGYATSEGTRAYSQRSTHVNQSNFKEVEMPKGQDKLYLSKLAYGTGRSYDTPIEDMF